MGNLSAAHDAVEAKGRKTGWVDHELARYKLARPALSRKRGHKLDRDLTVGDGMDMIDNLAAEREGTKRSDDRAWQPKHSRVLKLLTAKVDPVLDAMLAQEALSEPGPSIEPEASEPEASEPEASEPEAPKGKKGKKGKA